jgi:hypothetical protein
VEALSFGLGVGGEVRGGGLGKWRFYTLQITTNSAPGALLITTEYAANATDCTLQNGLFIAETTFPTPYNNDANTSHKQVGHFESLQYLFIPREELGMGTWYLGIYSPLPSSSICTFTILARFQCALSCRH